MDIRIRQAERRQAGFELVDIEGLVVDDHPVRAVWSFVEGLDLQSFYDRIKARGETPGRPATDPRILLALWLYATADGIGSVVDAAKANPGGAGRKGPDQGCRTEAGIGSRFCGG
jgi:transposase